MNRFKIIVEAVRNGKSYIHGNFGILGHKEDIIELLKANDFEGAKLFEDSEEEDVFCTSSADSATFWAQDMLDRFNEMYSLINFGDENRFNITLCKIIDTDPIGTLTVKVLSV